MPLNLIKEYPQLLDLAYLSESHRTDSLMSIFNRDIKEHPNLSFRTKPIRPYKDDESAMHVLFKHLTCEEITEKNSDGSTYPKRVFEMDRSVRLHWIRHHIEEKKSNLYVFSVEERDQKKRKDIIKTYIYDYDQKYVIILEPQRSKTDYYLLTAYYLNKKEGKKNIDKKMKRKLPDIY